MSQPPPAAWGGGGNFLHICPSKYKTENFKVYQTRQVILAFKFLSKKRIGNSLYEKRELREFFKVWNTKLIPIDIVCKYDGTTYGLISGKRKSIKLKDYRMPFKEKKRSLN